MLAAFAAFTGACGGKSEAAGGPGAAGAMKMPVAVVTLHDEPVRDASDYLAQLVSRHQVALYPQVLGAIGAIYVKPGDRVKRGAALMLIDPRKEAANLSNQVAAKGQKEAALDLAKVNEKRTIALLKEGLVSRQQFDQDQSLRVVAEQDLKAQEASIQAQQTQLGYYRIIAPFDGIVGDIPVKLGDFVSQTTKLTSVDENQTLEAYVNVPADKLRLLGPQSRIQILDETRALIAEAPVTFVAEEANPLSQAVLIKASFPNDKALRPSQVVRSRVVWSSHAGLRVPTSAVTRQSGQYFVFVAEPAAPPAQGTAARQRPITVGDVDDSRFAVLSGLKEGDRVIMTQLQKLRDGAPVEATEQPLTAPDGGAAPASSGAPPKH